MPDAEASAPDPPYQPPIARLTCHAPHPDPAKKRRPCSAILGDVPGHYEFVTTATRAPEDSDLNAWLRCPRAKCGLWNSFRLTASPVLPVLPVLAPAGALRTLEERMAALPEDQLQAATALASGLSNTQTGRVVGVDRRTITRWRQNPEFNAIRRAIAPIIAADHVRTALEGFFTVLEKDRAKGVAHNFRWFLSRTVFAEFEQARAEAGGSAVNVNVTQGQLVQQKIQSVWDARRRGE